MNKGTSKAIRTWAKINTDYGNKGDEEKEYKRLKSLYKSAKRGRDITHIIPMNSLPEDCSSRVLDNKISCNIN